jgi:uncharacterized protein
MKLYWLSAVAFVGLIIAAQGQPAPGAGAAAPFEWGPGLKVLIIGGGWAHDYETWDNKFDTEVLHKAGITSTHYTEDSAVATRELSNADVVLMSCNKNGFDTPAFRQAFENFVNAGKGIVPLHSGTFYSWGWGYYYTNIVGSGAHDHDGTSQFDETVLKEHPVTHGLPPTFQITDELYHMVPEPTGSPREFLVEASKPGGQKYPSVWLVHYGKARIVCIALGHDGPPRQSPEFSTLLVNAVNWAGGK